jgi:hypothetical protein
MNAAFLQDDNVSVTPSGFWLERLTGPRVPLALHPGLRVLRPRRGLRVYKLQSQTEVCGTLIGQLC